jgi:predicted DCC family thiol-disulfide oxidoreductase YuxK
MTPGELHASDLRAAQDERPILLFDGVCNLCNRTVQFVIDRDPAGVVRFAPLQSDAARRVLAARGRAAPEGELDSVLLVEGARVYERSDAALRVARRLRGGWPLLYAFIVVPRSARDLVYRFVAKHRYRWFGRTEACRVPTPEVRARFLS